MHLRFTLSEPRTVSTWLSRLCHTVGALSFVLLMEPVLAQVLPELTVVRQSGTQSWSNVSNRLDLSNISYQTLDGSDLTPETLANTRILFLPNVGRLTAEQVQALINWAQQGSNQLILSGPLQVPPDWEQPLRDVVGSYWSRTLATSTSVVPTPYSSSEWAQEVAVTAPVKGGILLPHTVDSRLIARWEGLSRDAYAVIATQQVVYFGWLWGETDPKLDQQWLEAALSRAGEIQAQSETRPVTEPVVSGSVPRPAFTPLVPLESVQSAEGSLVQSTEGSLVQSTEGSLVQPTEGSLVQSTEGSLVQSTEGSLVQSTEGSLVQSTEGSLVQSTEGSNESFKSDEGSTALPIAVVEPLTINTFEILSMKLELRNLVGRVESAFILTQSQGQSGQDQAYQSILANARSVIRNLDKWVANNEQTKARQEFEKAREQLWANYPTNALTTLPEVRAIWLDRGTIVEAGSERGLAEVFDRLAKARINTVFFETINAGFPIYPSRIAPEQNPLTRGWDPLATAVKLAHERGIELHCWMWTFAVGNRRHNVLPAINLPEDYPGPVLTAYPEWANVDHRGRLFPGGSQPETWFDPANPEVRAYLLALIREMMDYGVDGIQLDYIRYPFQNAASGVTFGYGSAARQQFERLTGVDPLALNPRTDRSLWQLWTNFRADQVDSFVAEVADLIQATDPNVILSAAVYALPENERVQKLQQDWEHWILNGDLDLLVPLTYAGNTRRLAQLVEPNLDIVRESPVLFLPSLNLLDLPKVEFLDQMQVVRDLPTGGYSLFAARQLTEELQDVLSQSALSSEQIPYRDPFKAAQARFQVLKQEWDYLLELDEIRILEDQKAAWLSQIAQVEVALDQLAMDPNVDHLAKAQSVLEDLRVPLTEWMRLDALQNPYRLETWSNRLAAIEILLLYGNRVLPRLTAMHSK